MGKTIFHKQIDVEFAYMPYSKISHPALGASILKSCLENNNIKCKINYYSINFAQLIGTRNYLNILYSTPQKLVGEWTFSRAAFGEDFLREQQNRFGREHPYLTDHLIQISEIAEEWIIKTAEKIAENPPKILVCSSMFEQNVASMAILKEVKKRCPSVKTVMGGPNTEGVLGLGLLRRAPWLDYICAGEGEKTLPQLCKALIENKDILEKPLGVMNQTDIQRYEGSYQINVNRPSVENMNESPLPQFDDYFNALENSNLQITPGLLLESSRGCWWGQRSQCTFCGLNGDGMMYRAKEPNEMAKETKTISDMYKIKKIEFVDNIIAKNYFEDFLPLLKDEELSMFYETKADFKEQDALRFHESGVRFIQPGIESLLDPVLAIMKKGTSGALNVECLRLCREYGIKPAWSVLCGFPGEKEEWYKETASLIPKLRHLQAPNGMISIRYDRFSPHHDNPEKWGLDLVPYDSYQHVYPDYEGQYDDIAYFFKQRGKTDLQSSPAIEGVDYEICKDLIAEWRKNWTSIESQGLKLPELTLHTGITNTIIDTRDYKNEAKNTEITPEMCELIRYCRVRKRLNSILAYQELNARKFQNQRIEELLVEAMINDWIVKIGKNFVSLVQEKNHQYVNKRKWPGGYLDKHYSPEEKRLQKEIEIAKQK